MTVYLAWVSADPGEPLAGPWTQWRTAAPGLVLLESVDTLSTVYHALKWQLPDDAALVVARLDTTPKSRGLAPGTTSWLRSRTTPPQTLPRRPRSHP